jgi:hypothetical protein
VRLLQADAAFGKALERHHHKSFESELYRLFKIYLEGNERS